MRSEGIIIVTLQFPIVSCSITLCHAITCHFTKGSNKRYFKEENEGLVLDTL